MVLATSGCVVTFALTLPAEPILWAIARNSPSNSIANSPKNNFPTNPGFSPDWQSELDQALATIPTQSQSQEFLGFKSPDQEPSTQQAVWGKLIRRGLPSGSQENLFSDLAASFESSSASTSIQTQPGDHPFSLLNFDPSISADSLTSWQIIPVPGSRIKSQSNFTKTLKVIPAQSTPQSPPSQSPTIPRTPAQPPAQTRSGSPVSESDQPRIDLTLRDTVILALENNRTIQNQYLERIVQRQDLAVAEDIFTPDFTPALLIGWNNLESAGSNAVSNNLEASADLRLRVPTGGTLSFLWRGQGAQQDGRSFVGQNDFVRQRLVLTLTQPLLRNAGAEVNRAPVRIARIDETINLLTLKQTLINEITAAILAYRNLLQAQERLVIARSSLASAEQQVEDTQVLIDAGRRPAIDIITVQRDVATQQVGLLNAEGSVQQSQLNLLEILDLSDDLNVVAIDTPMVESPALDFAVIQQIALNNQPNYLQSQLEINRAELNLLIAENNRRWNIDLSANINHNPSGDIIEQSTDFRAGIVVSKTLGDPNLERDFQRNRVNLLQAENNLREANQRVNIAVEDRIRAVNESFEQVQLAQRVTQLAEQELQNEEEKFRLGVDTSILELVRLRNNLEQTKNDELNAKIEYLNALTNLDREIGATLETWEIIIEPVEGQN